MFLKALINLSVAFNIPKFIKTKLVYIYMKNHKGITVRVERINNKE